MGARKIHYSCADGGPSSWLFIQIFWQAQECSEPEGWNSAVRYVCHRPWFAWRLGLCHVAGQVLPIRHNTGWTWIINITSILLNRRPKIWTAVYGYCDTYFHIVNKMLPTLHYTECDQELSEAIVILVQFYSFCSTLKIVAHSQQSLHKSLMLVLDHVACVALKFRKIFFFCSFYNTGHMGSAPYYSCITPPTP